MGQYASPNQTLTSVYVGSTTEASPTLLLLVGGVTYANGYRITYSGAYQNFFPGKDGNNIYLYCYTVVFGADLGAVTVNNIEVLVINTAVQTTTTGNNYTDITGGLGIGYSPP